MPSGTPRVHPSAAMNVPPSLRPLRDSLGVALCCAAVLPCCRGPREPVAPRPAAADAGPVARPATPRAGDAAVPDGPTGSIAGVVRINGPLPAPVPIPVDAETARRPGCAEAAQNWYARLFPVSQPGPLPWAVVTADARSQAAPHAAQPLRQLPRLPHRAAGARDEPRRPAAAPRRDRPAPPAQGGRHGLDHRAAPPAHRRPGEIHPSPGALHPALGQLPPVDADPAARDAQLVLRPDRPGGARTASRASPSGV
jgi:hypothetical protein